MRILKSLSYVFAARIKDVRSFIQKLLWIIISHQSPLYVSRHTTFGQLNGCRKSFVTYKMINDPDFKILGSVENDLLCTQCKFDNSLVQNNIRID